MEIIFSSFLLVLSFYMLMHTVKCSLLVFPFLVPSVCVCVCVHARARAHEHACVHWYMHVCE
jgi:hypothetical protein